MRKKKYKQKIPKIIYNFVGPKNGEIDEGLIEAYTIVFREVMKSQDWR